MATYCIGDLHACYAELIALLRLINFDPHTDHLYLTGDLIGRGPQPVETLNFLLDHRDSITAVLGNHDLNFLAVSYGLASARPRDNLQVLLDNPRFEEYRDYLLHNPLLCICPEHHFVVIHAGLYPLWSIARARERTAAVERLLRNPLQARPLLGEMYGDTPECDDPDLNSAELRRFVLNACTRMRFIHDDGRLDYTTKDKKPSELRDGTLCAWFDHQHLQLDYQGQDYRLVFGHWAALQGECQRNHVIALDTACIWGGRLSCWCADTGQYRSVPSHSGISLG